MPEQIRRVNTCAFCPDNKVHIIDPSTYPEDRFAQPVRTTMGIKYKCGVCYRKEREDMVLKQASDSPAAREIREKRRREIEDQRRRINGLMKMHNLRSV